jgi:hypothetical protein
VSVARGEQDYFDAGGITTATEGCKSNALMRCCKDLGIASELWYISTDSLFNAGIHGLFVNSRKRIVSRRLRNMLLRKRYESYGDAKMMCLNIHTRRRSNQAIVS